MQTQSPQARKALVFLTAVNYFNYIDRFILAAVLSSIKADLGLSDFQAGLLATAFMIPYMFTAPIFGWLADTRSRSKILSLGIGLWSVATFVTGYAKNFVVMMTSRFFLGVGESAFTSVSIPFLSEHFPPEKRGRILAIFSSGLPVGAALGYVLGGFLGSTVGWRNAFYIVGFPGLFLAAAVWFLKDPRASHNKEQYDFKAVFKFIAGSKYYLSAVGGYCAYTFVVGGVAHWIPTYVQRTYEVSQLHANTIFGGIAVVSGLIGTLAGGWIGDSLEKRKKEGHLKTCAISMFLALPFFYLCMQAETMNSFIVFLTITQLLFFTSTSPINVALLKVPATFRNSAMAISIFLCHILGDAISSPLIGKFSDMTGSLKSGILICAPVLLLSSALWWWGSRLSGGAHAEE
ncbi:MAG: spinster family MFS transporter [Pseudobdellovibrionaceae bacterium]